MTMAEGKSKLETVGVNKGVVARISLEEFGDWESQSGKELSHNGNLYLSYMKGIHPEHTVLEEQVECVRLDFTEDLDYMSFEQFKRMVSGLNEFLEFITNNSGDDK